MKFRIAEFYSEKGFISSSWRSYLYDIAFQNWVTKNVYPHWEITPYLMLADKNKRSSVSGMNQLFTIKKDQASNKSYKIDRDLESEILGDKLLTKVNVSKAIKMIYSGKDKDQKDKVLNNFLKKNIDVLISTTVIEVGVDFPDANVIVIENSNKFGLSQLHQLRGRVGRGTIQGTCILLYKKNLSENAKKRIKILKSSNDGFYIAEEDMKLRGFGDVLGFQQSGMKDFKLADPVHHEDLFKIAEQNIKDIELNQSNFNKYDFLLKLFDKADIINEINQD